MLRIMKLNVYHEIEYYVVVTHSCVSSTVFSTEDDKNRLLALMIWRDPLTHRLRFYLINFKSAGGEQAVGLWY